MESQFLIDWVSFTTRNYSPSDLIEFLGLQKVNWENIKGAHGYRQRLYWNMISIHFAGSESQGVWVEMSGQGCRAFESFGSGDFNSIFTACRVGEFKITRLDIAFDDLDDFFDIRKISNDTLEQNFTSRFDFWEVIQSSKGTNINHGSPKSDLKIRIYDKALERGYTDGRHWIRLEMQLRDDRALSFLQLESPIGNSFKGVLHNYLNYRTPSKTDSERYRWPIRRYWSKFLGVCEKIKLYVKPGIEYNLAQCEHFVYKQAGNAIDALIRCYGVKSFLEHLENRDTMQNPKYEMVIAEYNSLHTSASQPDYFEIKLQNAPKAKKHGVTCKICDHHKTIYHFKNHRINYVDFTGICDECAEMYSDLIK